MPKSEVEREDGTNPSADQERAERHQQARAEAVEGEADERRSDRVNEKIGRSYGSAVAARPGKFLQQSEVVNSEGAVDAAHDDHVGETQREDDVAVEKLRTHERIGGWSVEYWSVGL